MRIVIGIILIVVSSVLFTLLLPENTPWIIVTSPLFIVGVGLICSKVNEMEDDIIHLEVKLNDVIKKGQKE